MKTTTKPPEPTTAAEDKRDFFDAENADPAGAEIAEFIIEFVPSMKSAS